MEIVQEKFEVSSTSSQNLQLEAKHIRELTILAKPPAMIETIMEVAFLCLYPNENNFDWKRIVLSFKSPTQVFAVFESVDYSQVTEEHLEFISSRIKSSNITIEIGLRNYKAAGAMAKWILDWRDASTHFLQINQDIRKIKELELKINN